MYNAIQRDHMTTNLRQLYSVSSSAIPPGPLASSSDIFNHLLLQKAARSLRSDVWQAAYAGLPSIAAIELRFAAVRAPSAWGSLRSWSL